MGQPQRLWLLNVYPTLEPRDLSPGTGEGQNPRKGSKRQKLRLTFTTTRLHGFPASLSQMMEGHMIRRKQKFKQLQASGLILLNPRSDLSISWAHLHLKYL